MSILEMNCEMCGDTSHSSSECPYVPPPAPPDPYPPPTLRPRYAMAALTGLLATGSFEHTGIPANTAHRAFRFADALIAAERAAESPAPSPPMTSAKGE